MPFYYSVRMLSPVRTTDTVAPRPPCCAAVLSKWRSTVPPVRALIENRASACLDMQIQIKIYLAMALAWSLLSTCKRFLEVTYKAVVAQVSNPVLHYSCSLLVSWARPSHSTAFSSFRINMWREGLAYCLYLFGSSQTRCWLANQIRRKCDYVMLNF